jgi:ketosteroid isomerase-like protein
MSDHSSDQPPADGGTPVPDLIARYRVRRDAWIAQADELARLRDEVRGSAEREAMEIVTLARRNVRQVVMDARRELLVLSAQVQAALGETSVKGDPAALLQKAGIAAGERALESATLEASVSGFAPDEAVNEILDEVQADMQALAEDARTLPLRAAPPVAIERVARVESPFAIVEEATPAATPDETTSAQDEPLPERAQDEDSAWVADAPEGLALGDLGDAPASLDEANEPAASRSLAGLSGAASRVLLSPPFSGTAVPVPQGRSVRTFVGLIAGIAVLVVLATVWVLRRDGTGQPGPAPAVEEMAIADPVQPVVEGEPASAPVSAPAPALAERRTVVAGNLSLVAEALREVWVRTTVDGQADSGRTLAAGETITASAAEIISLRVGDAGALVVSVNQGEGQPFGPDGLVVTREFVAEGYRPSADPEPAGATAPPLAPAGPAPDPVTLPPTVQGPTPPVPGLPASPAASAARPAAAPASPTAAATISPATVVVAAARQWLDAYHRQDNATMSALSTENLLLADERRPDERFPAGLGGVQRTLDRVSVQIAADTAVLTAVMTEQSDSSTAALVSPVSQVWVRGEDGRWKVRQARFVSEGRLSQVFR